MKTIIYIFFSLVLFSCKNEKEEPEKKSEIENQQSLTKKLTSSQIKADDLPKSISFVGNFKQGYQWSDTSGKYLVFTTETGLFRDENAVHEFDDSSDAALYAYCYKLTEKEPTLRWKIYDYVNDCPVDIVAEFIDKALKVTDLDANGIAEIWTMYKTTCHGDVSPLELKIIMYEGDKKYALRGESKVQVGIDDDGNSLLMGGDFKMDNAFLKGPELFRNFAVQLWKNNNSENQG